MISLGNIKIGGGNPLILIAGPCVVENREITLRTAAHIQKVTHKHRIPCIFKASYKKANRTSGESFVGLDMDEAFRILMDVKSEFDIPVLTDIHSEMEAAPAAEVADVLQVPAFLSRQTEILQAAGRTGRVVNIKKGQFLAPEDMQHQIEKVRLTGNDKVMITERGTTFGYHNLVVDMRSLVIMSSFGAPVVLDVTHSVQLPGAGKAVSSGQPEFIFPIARAGVAVGVDGVFIETHPDPSRALSDAASQLKLDLLEDLIRQVMKIDALIKRKIS